MGQALRAAKQTNQIIVPGGTALEGATAVPAASRDGADRGGSAANGGQGNSADQQEEKTQTQIETESAEVNLDTAKRGGQAGQRWSPKGQALDGAKQTNQIVAPGATALAGATAVPAASRDGADRGDLDLFFTSASLHFTLSMSRALAEAATAQQFRHLRGW